ncbi:centromere protein H [Phyllobates terribilis]|uniref:centromere protein H n=1 Tax=Phyllobates terribilis TaxID=111132 RepID=UPI003CCB0FD8
MDSSYRPHLLLGGNCFESPRISDASPSSVTDPRSGGMARAGEEQRADMAAADLVSLEQQSVELGRVALMRSRDHKLQPAASTLLLLKELKKLKQQKFDLENRIQAEEISMDEIPPENLTTENLTEIIEKLKKEIEKVEVTHHNKSLLLRRLQIYDAIRNKLSEKSRESQMIHETMEHTRGLCDHIQALQKEARTLEEQMIDVRKKRLQLRETCTTLMADLRAMKEKQRDDLARLDNPKFKKIHDYIKKEADTVTVIQNVFQRLVLGSGVNWAEDPNLKQILLKMGTKNPSC